MKESKPSVLVHDDTVFVGHLTLVDDELVELIRESDDPERALTTCAVLGARVLRSAQTTVDVSIVDKRFTEFEHRLEQGFGHAVDLVTKLADGYFDPNTGQLREILDGLEKTVDSTFDPKSKASAVGKIEALLASATRDLKRTVRDMVDPGNAESPLGRLRGEVGCDLDRVRQSIEQLSTQVANQQGQAQILELTAIKGRRFEAAVFEAASAFVSEYGDAAEPVGDLPGSDGGRCGDIVVSLDDADTDGQSLRYVIEVKDRKLPLNEALRELDTAMANRDATAAVMVFSGQQSAPIRTPVRWFASRAIVVLDKSDPNPQALRLALMFARMEVQRRARVPREGVDTEELRDLLDRGQRTIARHALVKRCHSAAQRSISSAAGQVKELVDDVEEVLQSIGRVLSRETPRAS
jgi:hypothetical protein